MSKVFDTHSHYMPPEIAQNTAFFKVNWSNIDGQLSLMDQVGIEQALLLYPTSDAHLNMGGWSKVCQIYNQEINNIIKRHPSRFIGSAILPGDNTKNIQEELKHLDDLDLKALSLASSYDGKYLDDEMFFEVFEYAQKRKMPIHVHPQIINPIGFDRINDPLLTPVLEYIFDVSMCIGKLMMNEIFLKFPDVKFIFAHYGGVLPIVRERFDNTYLMLRKRNFVKDLKKLPGEYFKNLYFDTSGSKSTASLLCALEVTDASHILWGSDFPANQNVSEAIAVVRNSPLSQKEKDLVMSQNFLQLIEN